MFLQGVPSIFWGDIKSDIVFCFLGSDGQRLGPTAAKDFLFRPTCAELDLESRGLACFFRNFKTSASGSDTFDHSDFS